MRNGTCFAHPTWARNTKEKGYGFLPTPTCHNAKEGNYPAEHNRRTPLLATHAGGKINPEWTEWLMGWPIGWTDLKPLETDRLASSQQSRSTSFHAWESGMKAIMGGMLNDTV
jgi:hypothetical protein